MSYPLDSLKQRYMEKEKLDFYESPLVEVIEVEVEKGFAESNAPGIPGEGGQHFDED